MDAAARLAHLAKAFAPTHLEDAPPLSASEAGAAQRWRQGVLEAGEKGKSRRRSDGLVAPENSVHPSRLRVLGRQLFKSAIGLLVIAVVGLEPLRNYFASSSLEAIVNAQMTTLRSPIDGIVRAAPSPKALGAELGGPATTITVADPEADPSRLDQLTHELEQARDEAASASARLESGRALLADLKTQTQNFIAGRLRQLIARREQLQAEADAAGSRADIAKATAARTGKLAAANVASGVQRNQTLNDADVAALNELAARKQVEAATVEIDALRAGVFIGDAYNDRPQSAQRAAELTRELADLEAAATQAQTRASRLQSQWEDERARYSRLSSAAIAAPPNSRIFEILAAPGERVHKGQDLMRVFDCSSAVVTAVVGESVYDQLRIGAAARFLPRGGGPAMGGRVIGLTGASPASSNFGILPSALIGASYHVTIDVPELAQADDCAFGRTGRVIFSPEPAQLRGGL